MQIRWSLSLLVVLAFLTSCAETTTYWRKAGASQKDLDIALAECRMLEVFVPEYKRNTPSPTNYSAQTTFTGNTAYTEIQQSPDPGAALIASASGIATRAINRARHQRFKQDCMLTKGFRKSRP